MFKPPMSPVGVEPRTPEQIAEVERRLKSLYALFRPLVSVKSETRMLVLGWLNTLFEADEVLGAGEPFDLGMLDEAMLPPAALPNIDEVLTGRIPPKEARGILRAVKATLPAGQIIPEDARVILEIEDVNFKPEAKEQQ